jgi:hypothetical protein
MRVCKCLREVPGNFAGHPEDFENAGHYFWCGEDVETSRRGGLKPPTFY